MRRTNRAPPRASCRRSATKCTPEAPQLKLHRRHGPFGADVSVQLPAIRGWRPNRQRRPGHCGAFPKIVRPLSPEAPSRWLDPADPAQPGKIAGVRFRVRAGASGSSMRLLGSLVSGSCREAYRKTADRPSNTSETGSTTPDPPAIDHHPAQAAVGPEEFINLRGPCGPWQINRLKPEPAKPQGILLFIRVRPSSSSAFV